MREPYSSHSLYLMEAEATPLLHAAITGVLQEVPAAPSAAMTPANEELSRKISAAGASRLTASFPGVKFVVQCLLLPAERAESGFAMSSAAVWDAASDSTFSVRWESPDRLCIVTVVAIGKS